MALTLADLVGAALAVQAPPVPSFSDPDGSYGLSTRPLLPVVR